MSNPPRAMLPVRSSGTIIRSTFPYTPQVSNNSPRRAAPPQCSGDLAGWLPCIAIAARTRPQPSHRACGPRQCLQTASSSPRIEPPSLQPSRMARIAQSLFRHHVEHGCAPATATALPAWVEPSPPFREAASIRPVADHRRDGQSAPRPLASACHDVRLDTVMLAREESFPHRQRPSAPHRPPAGCRLSQSSRRRFCRNVGSAGMYPPSPCTGSTSIAPATRVA